MTLELNFLGTPEVKVLEHPLVFRTRKALALLAYLVLESGWHDRERLTGLFWPDADETQGRSSLRKALSFLRAAFEFQHVQMPLLVRRDALSFDRTAALDLDVNVLARAFGSNDPVLLEDAARAYRAEFLHDFMLADSPAFEVWAQVQREQARVQVGDVLERLADWQVGNGNSARAEISLRRRVQLDVLNEDAHRALIAFFVQVGNRAAALEAFHACRMVLESELGAKPDSETLALMARAQNAALSDAALFEPSEPVLVGREREWALLETAWQQGQTVLISGAPGVGKSRLALEFAESKGRILRLWGRPGDAAVPYSTHARNFGAALALAPDLKMPDWVRLEMSRILPQLGLNPPPLVTDADKLRFFEAKWEFYRLIAPQGWDIQVFDDVQFVDSATAEAGIYLHSKLLPYQPGFPRTIFVFRAGELEPRAEARLREWVAAGLAVWLDLEPLREQDLRLLLSNLNDSRFEGLAGAMQKFTGGNPLLVLETVRAMLEQNAPDDPGVPLRLPRSVKAKAVTVGRLSRLGSAAQSLARLAAVAGETYSLELVARVLKLDTSVLLVALEELERASIMHGLRFTHDLIFEAVLEDMPETVRMALHGQVLDALLEPDVDAGFELSETLLLVHAEGAQRWAAVFKYAVAAAVRARDLYLFQESIRFERRALELVDTNLVRPQATQIFSVFVSLAKTLGAVSEVDQARVVLEGLLKDARAVGDLAFQAQALMMLGSNAASDGAFALANERSSQAITLASFDPDAGWGETSK